MPFFLDKIPINVVIYFYYHTEFGKSQHAKLESSFVTVITILFEGNLAYENQNTFVLA